MKYLIKIVPVLLFITPLIPSYGGQSLTLSPLSFTSHTIYSKDTKHLFSNTVLGLDTTTYHLGAHAMYRNEGWQTAAWFFSDSFGNTGGGLVGGPNWRFWKYFSFGAVVGVYVREKYGTVGDLPVSLGFKDIEAAPIGGATISANIPVSDDYGVETNCISGVVLTNCSVGLRIDF